MPEELNASASESIRIVQAEGMAIRVAVRAGAAGRTPLVLFNGIGATLEMLGPFLDALGPGVPSLRFDAPGIGGSPAPAWPYRFAGLARAVNAVCDQLGYAEVDVFGLSWGGAVAQEFVHLHGKRVRRLVLAATSAGAISLPSKISALLEMAGPLRHLRPGRKKGEGAASRYGGDFRRKPELAGGLAQWFAATGSAGYYFQMLAGAGWTSVHWLPTLRQATLILAGAEDPLVPLPNARMLAALIPKARLVTYDCGHLFILTRLSAVVAEVRAFLS